MAKAPVSSWAVTFGYYTVITTKNTLLFFFFLNRHIPQEMWVRYHKHQINFQKTYRHKVFHNLDPDAELEVQNTMNQIKVREALA